MGCVFPTPVGVFPIRSKVATKGQSLPHARGGVSSAWAIPSWSAAVFPTPVGVFLKKPPERLHIGSLPHARGGVSAYKRKPLSYARSSPRPWGCFSMAAWKYWLPDVFPTPVGVFLR